VIPRLYPLIAATWTAAETGGHPSPLTLEDEKTTDEIGGRLSEIEVVLRDGNYILERMKAAKKPSIVRKPIKGPPSS
jgi:hypothetical protein